jgi:hypothetical protein
MRCFAPHGAIASHFIHATALPNDCLIKDLGNRRSKWHTASHVSTMECVIGKREVVSRHYLEQLRIKLQREGDDRLARQLDDCDTLRFALEWITCLAATGLITLLVQSAWLAHGWYCLTIVLAGGLLGVINRAVDQRLLCRYNRRFYEAIPEDLRWCFRRTP